jgi:GNAT superfamily N-acetyltransferase
VVRLREAGPWDAKGVAALHGESWRRHYRGAYADSYLDGDILTERKQVWSGRLGALGNNLTVVAEDAGELVGFVHVVFDLDTQYGSLVDNLHVTSGRQRRGVGRALLTQAAEAVVQRAESNAMYLWVLEQNSRAQAFYSALGGTTVDKAPVPPPGGMPDRLTGNPYALRVFWPYASAF